MKRVSGNRIVHVDYEYTVTEYYHELFETYYHVKRNSNWLGLFHSLEEAKQYILNHRKWNNT